MAAYIAIFTIVLLAGFLIYASASIKSGIYLKSRCTLQDFSAKGESTGRPVALTFDDGPDPVTTPKILDLLKRENIRATFFLTGEKASAYPQLVRMIADEGHSIGSHSWSHAPTYPLKGYSSIKEEIRRGAYEIDSILNSENEGNLSTGKGRGSTRLFRPPFGVTNPPIARAVKELGLISIGWSARSFDTQFSLEVKKKREMIVRRLCKKIKPGAIILLHDRLKGAEILLEELVSSLKERGYEFVKIDE